MAGEERGAMNKLTNIDTLTAQVEALKIEIVVLQTQIEKWVKMCKEVGAEYGNPIYVTSGTVHELEATLNYKARAALAGGKET